MSTFISHASPRHLEQLDRYAARGEGDLWTVLSGVSRGSRIIFYIHRPISAFVAEGIVADDDLVSGADHGWPGKKMAYVRVIRMSSTPLRMRRARELFPDWGWLKSPISGSRVPAKYEGRLYAELFENSDDAISLQERPALEGAHSVRLVRHRRREIWKRQEKIRDVLRRTGRLTCEVPSCGFDFFERYGQVGHEYAQVHHLKPLSDRAEPSRTLLKDLAIVCANCHAMIHRGGACRPIRNLIPHASRSGQ